MTLGVPVASEIGFRLGWCWKFSLTSRQGYLKQASAARGSVKNWQGAEISPGVPTPKCRFSTNYHR